MCVCVCVGGGGGGGGEMEEGSTYDPVNVSCFLFFFQSLCCFLMLFKGWCSTKARKLHWNTSEKHIQYTLLVHTSSPWYVTVTSRGRRALLRRRPEDDEATQLGREWNRTFIECKTRGYIGFVDSRIRHIRRLPDLAVAQYRNDPKPRGSARHESARITKHNNEQDTIP